MSAIGRKRDPEWQRLRKQLLALKDRLAKRINSKAFEDKYQKRENYVLGTLKIIKENTSPATWQKILEACKIAMPVLKKEIEANSDRKILGMPAEYKTEFTSAMGAPQSE